MTSQAESRGDAKLRRRILVVGLTGALPLFLVALWLLQGAYRRTLEFGERELRGVAFEQRVQEVLESLVRYSTTSGAPRVDSAVAFDAALGRLRQAYEGALGRELGFVGSELRARERHQAALGVLVERWRALGERPTANGVQAVATSLIAMSEHAGDSSNLILDHDLDSYYLSDLVLSQPAVRARLLEAVALAREPAAEPERRRLAVLLTLLREQDVPRVDRDARSTLREDAAFYGVSASLQSTLPGAVAEYRDALQALLAGLERVVAGQRLPPQELEALAGRGQAASGSLGRVGAIELATLIEHRLMAARTERTRAYWALAATLAGAAVAMGVMIRGLLAARYAEILENQQQLRDKEAQLRALGDNLPGGMTYQVVRERDGSMRFLYVSAGVEALHGLTADAVQADPQLLYRAILPEDLPAVREAERVSLEQKMPFRARVRSRRKSDGAVLWLELSSAPRELPDGRVIWDGIQMDVTEQLLSEQRFSHIFDHSPIPITLSRASDGKFVAVNDSFLSFSGFSREEVLGHNSIELGVYADPTQRAAVVGELHKNGRLHGLQVPFRTKSGRVRDNVLWLELLTIGAEKFVLGMSLDVTEQKQAEQQQRELEEQLRQTQKLEALGTLAGGIAHDFNNILGAIISYAELSRLDNPDNRALNDYLGEVLRASQRATVLVRQILFFSRQQKEERRNLQLAPIVKEALSLLRATLPSTIAIEAKLDAPLGDVSVNATQVHQIVMNLCTNAGHAMKGKQGRIEAELSGARFEPGDATPHMNMGPGDYVCLRIADTGHGMDEATLKRIFEPFFTTKAPGEGTGLGLSVVHGIIKEYGGAVTVESTVGHGTTFRIYFPIAERAELAESAASSEVPRGDGQNVAYVDDEPALGDAAGKMLARLGYRPVVFQSASAALAAFRRDPGAFAVLVTDYTMPGLTGLELIREVLALRADLPVLLVSGSTGPLPEAELRAIGVRELLDKPLTYAALAQALGRTLRSARPS
jgi:PAS domain S-box-containing protein